MTYIFPKRGARLLTLTLTFFSMQSMEKNLLHEQTIPTDLSQTEEIKAILAKKREGLEQLKQEKEALTQEKTRRVGNAEQDSAITALVLQEIERKIRECDTIIEKEGTELRLFEIVMQTNMELFTTIKNLNRAALLKKDIYGRTSFYLACVKGNLDEVTRLLDREQALVDIADINGRTPLHVAAQMRHDPIVRVLLRRGAALEAADETGKTALHWAAMHGSMAVVNILLNEGARKDAIDLYGVGPLHVASFYGHAYVVRNLLGWGANVMLTDERGRTPLDIACMRGYGIIVKLLLAKPQSLSNALTWACHYQHKHITKALIEKGAEMSTINSDTKTYVMVIAIAEGNIPLFASLFESLISDYSDFEAPDFRCGYTGYTFLHLAARMGRAKIIRLLLDKRDTDMNARDFSASSLTPLHVAALYEQLEAVEALIERGAMIDMKDAEERTALYIAAKLGFTSILYYLLTKSAAKIDEHCSRGYTALHIAAENNHLKAVDMLLNAGASLKEVDSERQTPLHKAASKGHADVMKSLLKYRPPTIATKMGGKITEMVPTLLLAPNSSGEIKAMTDINGKTALQLAHMAGHPIQFLSETGNEEIRAIDETTEERERVLFFIDRYRFKEPRLIATIQHKNGVRAVTWSPDGSKVATASNDYTVQIWDVHNYKLIGCIKHDGYVNSVAWSPDGSKLATGSNDNTAQVWDLPNNKLISIIRHNGFVIAVVWSSDGSKLATASSDQTAQVWDIAKDYHITTIRHKDWVKAVAWSSDGSKLATASADCTAQIWDIANNKLISTIQHQILIYAVAWSPDGSKLATGSGDYTAQVWDIVNNKPITTIQHKGTVNAVAWSPDGTKIATASHDNTAQVWDISINKLMTTIQHTNYVEAVAWSPDGSKLATASDDSTAQVWDIANNKLITTIQHKGQVLAVAWSPDGSKLATGSGDHTAQVWEVGKPLD